MIDRATQKSFSYGWFKFARTEVGLGWFKDSFAYVELIPRAIIAGADRIGLDIGCGSGSDMLHIRSKFGSRVVGIDVADSLAVTKRNIEGKQGLCVCQADAYRLPFKDGTFDFAYSFGVLHHLPDPEAAFRSMIRAVKRGGYIAVYLYEDFSQRPRIDRVLLRTANLLRLITTRMSAPALFVLCVALAPAVLACCSLPYRILKNSRITSGFAERIPFRHTVRLDCIRADLYDRLSAPIEHRYSRSQVEAWFTRAGLSDTGIVYYRGWVAWGKRTGSVPSR